MFKKYADYITDEDLDLECTGCPHTGRPSSIFKENLKLRHF